MKKHFSKATPISVILNLILIINIIIVVYPVLFTISSSLTKSNSLSCHKEDGERNCYKNSACSEHSKVIV